MLIANIPVSLVALVVVLKTGVVSFISNSGVVGKALYWNGVTAGLFNWVTSSR